ncbi:endo-1,4-beta-xylanase [Fretibacter rubidus]|uniref:endo-1,4-beta-xylanase n=1 Tax=Fretibacter rubidus TaxID=570162 RepID=UPI003529E6F5
MIKTIFHLIIVTLFAVFAFAPATYANPAELEAEGVRVWKMLPRASEMIRHPGPEAWVIYGTKAKPKIKSVDDVPGGEAMRVKIKKAAANPWDIGVNANSQLAVKKGDVVLASFWARASKLPDGAAETRLPYALQMATDPYTQFKNDTAVVNATWNQYFIYAPMPDDYSKGGMGVAIQLATDKQEIELGPVYIMNMGAGAVSDAAMPKNVPARSDTNLAPIQKSAPAVQSASLSLTSAFEADLSELRAKLTKRGKLLANPAVISGAIFGTNESHRIVTDPSVTGGKALEVTVKDTGLNSWSTGVNWATQEPIKKGDVIFLAYWAKGISAQNEAQTPIISPVRVQQSAEPYKSALTGAAYLSRDWQLYYASGKSDLDIAAGPAGITFHLGLTKQTLRLGPAYLLNLGPNADINTLPRNKISYVGQEESAPWRAVAEAKIEAHRKGDMLITVKDARGNPVAGQSVNVAMTRHAFNFGTFVGHEFVGKSGQKDARYHESFHKNFNMATLPLYWQDWGWSGKWKDQYKEGVKYASETGLPWRGHPILWPGEDYMPSYILKAEGNIQKQRKQVLDHVREVMSFVKDYDPIAVDMVNEVRVNQYFKEQGDSELIADAFKLAHDIAPDIPLFVNDYAILNNGGLNEKSIDFYHDWIRSMRSKGVPLGGIGFQAHFGAGLTSPQRIMDILGDFAQYDLPLHITEFDVETFDEDAQANFTRDMLYAAFSEPKLDAFVVWGWWEGDHWKAPAAMLREDWSEKPNYRAWRDAVYRDWWTSETVVTNSNGQARLRGFKGDYTLTTGNTTTTAALNDTAEVDIIISEGRLN